MTIIEFAKMLDVSLNSAQITILNAYDEAKEKGQTMIAVMPRGYERQMLNAIIQRYEGYQQGIADERDRIIKELESYYSTVDRAISEDEFKIEGMKIAYLDAIEIVRGGENERD